MPRNVDPSSIQTGPGLAGPATSGTSLVVGAAPFIGELGPDQPHAYDPGQAALAAIKAHIQDVKDAHMASAIGVEDATPKQFTTENVEGAVNELFSAALPPPPGIGQTARYTTFTGIPDWGLLKMGDCSIQLRDITVLPLGTTNTNDAEDVFPYFLNVPTPSEDAVFAIPGSDPSTDLYFNGPSSSPIAMPVPIGLFSSGAITTITGDVIRTRVFPGGTVWPHITVSGTVFPADRGVLAILHIPSEGGLAEFLAQPLLKKCIAAILLGQGQEGEACMSGGACDGASGGIFDIGHDWTDPAEPYNPFAFPGRATGQYDLWELHTGTPLFGGVLNPPWNVPKIKAYQSPFTAYGQVRLGSDPDVGPVVDWGIPILGGSDVAYDETGIPQLPLAVAAPWTGMKYIGDSLILPATGNFFAYRLPCLGDYSLATGLKYTPRGVDPAATWETSRYFNTRWPYDVPVVGTPYQWQPGPPGWSPVQAGNYDDFDEDYWTWQIARYRHTFVVTGSDPNDIDTVVPSTEALGTYWLMHFKTEKDFEQLILNGAIPSSVYGADLLSATPGTTGSLVNELLAASQATPFGSAPDYGYSAPTYQVNRREIALGGTLADHQVGHADFLTSEFSLNVTQEFLMWVSGVAYFVPLYSDGTQAVTIFSVDVDVQNAWIGSYRTDDNWGTGSPSAAPAVISSPCPAMLSLAPFAYGSTPSYLAPPVLLSSADKARTQRIELGFTVLGSNGGGVFSDSNGPLAADHLTIAFTAPGDPELILNGDVDNPSFSVDACLRAYLRKPCIDYTWENSALPAWSNFGVTWDGHGHRLSTDTGDMLLFHSTQFVDVGVGKFGNFVTGGGAPYAHLYTQDKDTGERFLDEIYRYRATWTSAAGLSVAEMAYLVGPGMAGWGAGPLPVPARPDSTIDAKWKTVSWIWEGDHEETLLGTTPLYTHLVSELEVAGLPERNPPIGDWVTQPFPSAGLLKYPTTNYSAGYRPNGPDGAVAQPDYSTATGERGYVRAFDTAFSHAGALPSVPSDGQPFVIVRIDGLRLEDFLYAPGPLTQPNIFLKVPGLTTWMNVGRPDGAGPSKQDPALDGAGCQVVGPNTFNGVHSDTGMVYCQVKVNVGPAVNLAIGKDDEVPVLVKVVMPELPAGDWDLTKAYVGAGVFGPVGGPGIHCDTIRGLVGIQIVHPTLVETAP